MNKSLQNVRDSESKFQGDSLMIPLDRPSLTGSTLADAIATQMEKQGVFVKRKKKKRQMKKREKMLLVKIICLRTG